MTDRLADVRTSYDRGALREEDLAATPLEQFRLWLAQANEAGVGGAAEASSMVLATSAADGYPSTRTVLLKSLDARGFVFYSDRSSTKGRDLAANPHASLLFPWHPVQRQVVVVGDVEEVDADEAAAYFVSRPYGSRIGAWASLQSEVIGSREDLDRRHAEMAERYPDTGSPDDVPVPDTWVGWRVRPRSLEFWQGRPSRLHDRLRYVRTAADALLDDPSAWRVERLSP